ncbi:hypothetical protein R3P38DRAFT_3378595 [Favolaschia claudopus]|uniref:F-box domain-containing protein n=1 Tax=Favolaschia claudopus TaxID=2862362 RepID=A0AAV9Z847_9AGAR
MSPNPSDEAAPLDQGERDTVYEHQLKRLRDPVAHLPHEISCEIFTHYIPHPHERHATLSEPLTLLGVCTHWSETALSAPQIWSNVEIRIPSKFMITPDYTAFLDAWLARAKTRPLYLSFRGSQSLYEEITRIVVSHATHLRELVLPCIQYLFIFPLGNTTFPSLHTLRLQDNYSYNEGSLDAAVISQILRCTPQLRLLVFGERYLSRPTISSPSPTLHTSLTMLNIVNAESGESCILKDLTLPSLTHLELILWSKSHLDEFAGFLVRSAPPLREVRLYPWPQDSDSIMTEYRPTFERVLRLLGGLPSLHLCVGGLAEVVFYEILADRSNLPLLPSLTSLTVQHYGMTTTRLRGWFSALMNVLVARAASGLTEFELYVGQLEDETVRYMESFCGENENNERLPVVQELRAQGMRVDIRLVKENLRKLGE